MRHTLFLVGPSDIEQQSSTSIEFADSARVKGSVHWEGVLNILPYVMNDVTLKEKSIVGLVGVHTFNAPDNARLNVFNLVGDADASTGSLQKIQTIGREIRPLRFLNPPEAVYRTARERLQVTLANIPGCRLPRVVTCNATAFDELSVKCEAFAHWPLIVRARGYHRGEHMHLLENIAALERIKDSPWLYRGVLLIQFIDYRNARDLYQKTRIIVVDGVPYARHSIVSNQPFIHARNRADLMDQDDELCRGEADFLSYLRDKGLTGPELGGVFKAIHERIGLDIFGIDCAIIDRELVIFEANACMDFLNQDYGRNGRYRYLEPYIRLLKRAVKKFLMNE